MLTRKGFLKGMLGTGLFFLSDPISASVRSNLTVLNRQEHKKKKMLDEPRKSNLENLLKIDSNWVYVVSLENVIPAGWNISWIDLVKNKLRYFHPIGNKNCPWPEEPPNYIAFHYNGKLQSIHHIESYEVVTTMHERIPGIPDEKLAPHFLYTLGPSFGPIREVRSGFIYPKFRVWCIIDTLFTCRTIREAQDVFHKRVESEII